MRADLHLHSTASDGADAPARVVELAAEAGCEGIALTDHDTLSGIDEARDAADRVGIHLIPGVELSVDHDGTKMHLLAYGVEPGPGPLQDELAALRAGRIERNRKIVAALRDLGYDITLDDVEAQARGPSIGRPHIADALVSKGYVASRDEAFEHLLHDGGAVYFPRARLTAVRAIELTRAGGGVPVIAHPKTIQLRAEAFEDMLEELTTVGLFGLEAHHPMHDPQLRRHLTALASRFSLVATGGSDYHGMAERPYRVGTGTGDLVVPSEAFDAIAESIA